MKMSFSERLAGMFEVPREAISGCPIFIIRGRSEIEVSSCSGILEYSAKEVRLLLGGGDTVVILGENLILSDFRENTIYVRGHINSLGFCSGRCDKC